jgi:hypothetical protein
MVKNDFVQTPKYVTEALLANESFEGSILEPCCGAGAISTILQSKGYQVISSDKNDYSYGIQRDLFTYSEPFDNIITNPPFTSALQVAIAKHLLSIYKNKLCLLWYLKNVGNVMEGKVTSKGLKTVYVINQRIDWVETKLGWLFAWYIWEKGYEGDVTIRRIERGLTPLAPDSLKSGDSSLPESVKVENALPAESG